MSQCPTELNSVDLVKKVWGAERILVNNELYCAKYLYLKPNYQCSLHCHVVKDETFIVTEGEITLECGQETIYLHPGDSYRIKPRQWHRFANHGKKTARILEISTSHSDDDVRRREPSRAI